MHENEQGSSFETSTRLKMEKMTTRSTFCAIVVSFNGAKYLDHCIESLSSCQPRIDIVVIDNASTDKSVTIARSHKNVFVISLEENVGFGAANNIGIEYAYNTLKADYLLLVNQDAYINVASWPNFFNLPSHVTSNLVGLMQYGPDAKSFDYNFRKIYISEENCPGFIEDTFFRRQKDYYETQFLNAAAWIMPRELIETVGGFSPAFFHYGEDNNFVHRIHHWGFKLFLTPKISVIHDREEPNRRLSNYFQSGETKRRQYILKLANPSCSLKWWGFCLEALVLLVKDIFALRFGKFSASAVAIRLLLNRTISRTIEFRNQSLHSSSFLNLIDESKS